MARTVFPRTLTWVGLCSVLAIVAGLLAGTSAQARLTISPATITVSFDKGRPRGTFMLTNVGDKTERYRAKAVHFGLSEGGSLLILPPDHLSLAPWIRFNPTEFEIPPNARRVIRYSILAPKNLAHGEYWGGIEFEPLEGTLTSYSDDHGRNFDITVLTTAMVTIFGQKGGPQYGLEVAGAGLEITEDSTLVAIELQNSGMGKLNLTGGRYELLDQREAVVAEGELPPFPLLRGGRRSLKLPLDPLEAAGPYTLRVSVEAHQLEEPVEAQLLVSVIE